MTDVQHNIQFAKKRGKNYWHLSKLLKIENQWIILTNSEKLNLKLLNLFFQSINIYIFGKEVLNISGSHVGRDCCEALISPVLEL